MDNNQNNNIHVKGQTYDRVELLDNLVYIPANSVVNFFKEVGLNVPRQLRIEALRETLRPAATKTRQERQTLADEMGFRLSFFDTYGETQLVNLLEYYKDNTLRRQYFINFWDSLLSYLIEKGVHENDLMKLVLDAERYSSVKEREIPSSLPFNNTTNVIFYDEPGMIDGLTLETFRPVMYLSSTLTELRTIGAKYEADVPKRLRKKDVQEIVLAELADRGELTEELRVELLSKNIMVLERFAKDHDIKVSTELRKEEVIEYILKNANETREQYFEPTSSAVYEMKVEEVVEEEVVPEEVVEEVVEPIQPEEPKEEPTPVVTYNNEAIEATLKEVVEELKLIKEKIDNREPSQSTNAVDQTMHQLKFALLNDEASDLKSSNLANKDQEQQNIVIHNNIDLGDLELNKKKRKKKVPKTKFGKFMQVLGKIIKWAIILIILYLITLFILIGVDVFTTNQTVTNIVDILEKGVSWIQIGNRHLGTHLEDFFHGIAKLLNLN